MSMERVELKCRSCGSVYVINVDTEFANPKKLVLNACKNCPFDVRKVKFKAISTHVMKPKWIPVKEVPGMKVLAEVKQVKSKRYDKLKKI